VLEQDRAASNVTDWNLYYKNVPATATVTRKYTAAVLVSMIRQYGVALETSGLSIVEIGGANSCFIDPIRATVGTRLYDVIDTNEFGLSLLARRSGYCESINDTRQVGLFRQSVLDLSYEGNADLVFSVGLVEHFTPAETRTAILAHFDVLRPGGILIITFPTPTLLYRVTRRLIEMCGRWKFPDERPLLPGEVLKSIRERGEILYQKTLWPQILTQHLVVARKPLSETRP
jgi:SAM-dependent methyltransferase